MHAFCYSVPYGIIVMCGGVAGYFLKGSLMSLVMGLLFGGLSTALGFSVGFKP